MFSANISCFRNANTAPIYSSNKNEMNLTKRKLAVWTLQCISCRCDKLKSNYGISEYFQRYERQLIPMETKLIHHNQICECIINYMLILKH